MLGLWRPKHIVIRSQSIANLDSPKHRRPQENSALLRLILQPSLVV